MDDLWLVVFNTSKKPQKQPTKPQKIIHQNCVKFIIAKK